MRYNKVDDAMGTERIYATGGINWTWYVRVVHHNDGTVTITGHDRFHNDRDEHPEYTGTARVIENKARELIGVRVNDQEFPSRNRPNVFSLKW